MTFLKSTQTVYEALVEANPNLRASQIVPEILSAGNPNFKITRFVVEFMTPAVDPVGGTRVTQDWN